MNPKITPLRGANMDIDFSCAEFGPSRCPWDADEPEMLHRCAVKNTSICPYFCGVRFLDSVLCSYPNENRTVLTPGEADRPIDSIK